MRLSCKKSNGYVLMQNHGEHYELVEVEPQRLGATEQIYGMTSLDKLETIGKRKKCKLFLGLGTKNVL